MPSLHESLRHERDALDEHLERVNADILSEAFRTRNAEERKLLQRQALLMGEYLDVLNARLTLAGKEQADG